MQQTHFASRLPRRILVTGGSSGIGRAMAEILIQQDHNQVAILSRRQPGEWEVPPPTRWDYERNLLVGDLQEPPSVIPRVQRWLDGASLDILILSAVSYGFGSRHPLLETSWMEWETVMRVNVSASFLLVQSLLPLFLRQNHGLILYVSSEVAFNPGPQRISYSVSKTAAHAMFQGLVQELASTAIHIVGVAPEGMVDTPGIRKRRSPDFDYSSYASAASFAPVTLELAQTLGAGHHGQMIIVCADGSYRVMQNGEIPSQSKR